MSTPTASAFTVGNDGVSVPLGDRAGLGTTEASLYVGLSVPTLKKYRLDGTGPRYARIGSKIVYRPTDLDAYVEKHLVGGVRR